MRDGRNDPASGPSVRVLRGARRALAGAVPAQPGRPSESFPEPSPEVLPQPSGEGWSDTEGPLVLSAADRVWTDRIGRAEETGATDAPAEPLGDAAASRLTAEQEADLLAALTGDGRGPADDEPAEGWAAEHAVGDVMPEVDMARLLADAEAQLIASGRQGRGIALEHLRAAAAVQAEPDDAPALDAIAGVSETYRADLAAHRQPQGDAPVGTDIETGDGTAAEAEARFRAAAVEIGAGDLRDLVSAAAAHIVHSRKMPRFSRHALLGLVRRLDPQGRPRSDRLHAFGDLLATGRIEKVGPDLFSLASPPARSGITEPPF